MSSHLRDYPNAQNVVVPWNRRYTFPTVANKADKTTSRVQPRTVGPFAPNNVIQIDFPAQGYLNLANSFIEFDVTMTAASGTVRFENNIQSIFQRIEVKYGSTPLEDIDRANYITRQLTEWTATAGQTFDQTSIMEGIGNITGGLLFNTSAGTVLGDGPFNLNIRQKYIQGLSDGLVTAAGFGNVMSTRRYCVQPVCGIWQVKKLWPSMWMANQCSIHLTLAYPEFCMFSVTGTGVSYSVSNVNMIAETLTFDQTFDEIFLKGLQEGGIPIKFTTFHSYSFPTEANNNFSITDRSKSVKALYAMLRRSTPVLSADSGAAPFMPGYNHTLQTYQYQVGTKYYPASPVQCGSGTVSNGGAEAYAELAKALYTVGNYQLSSAVNCLRWGNPIAGVTSTYNGEAEADFNFDVQRMTPGNTYIAQTTQATFLAHGQVGSQCFCQAVCLESSQNTDYSGLNAEEASSIILKNTYSAKPGSTAAGCVSNIAYDTIVFVHIDKMIVLGTNNSMTLLE